MDSFWSFLSTITLEQRAPALLLPLVSPFPQPILTHFLSSSVDALSVHTQFIFHYSAPHYRFITPTHPLLISSPAQKGLFPTIVRASLLSAAPFSLFGVLAFLFSTPPPLFLLGPFYLFPVVNIFPLRCHTNGLLPSLSVPDSNLLQQSAV